MHLHVGEARNVAKLQQFLSGQLTTVTTGFLTFFFIEKDSLPSSVRFLQKITLANILRHF